MPYPPYVRGRMSVLALRSWFTRRVVLPMEDFFTVQETAGVPMILAAATALVWANVDLQHYENFWHTHITVNAVLFTIDEPLAEWINILLLPLFFFVIGVELKYELMRGQLSSGRRAALPLVMAVGGVILPAAVYLLLNPGGTDARGWGVPVATDIAFALGVLSLVHNRVPPSARLVLLGFAAVDDVVGVLIIAIFYSSSINWAALGLAMGLLLVLAALGQLGMSKGVIYALLGAVVLIATHFSGVHPTIAALCMGLLVHVRESHDRDVFADEVDRLAGEFRRAHDQLETLEGTHALEGQEREEVERARNRQEAILGELTELTAGSFSTAQDVLHRVNPWASYLVLPLFALAHAGVSLGPDQWRSAVNSWPAIGVLLGLLVGKPIGVAGAAWIGSRLNLCQLPDDLRWRHVTGLGMLAGIGFTVSLFIAGLAFESQKLAAVKTAVLLASVIAAVAGLGWLWLTSRDETP